MLQAFVVTLREGLEVFPIVVISLAYLRKTGRGQPDSSGALGHPGVDLSALPRACFSPGRPIRPSGEGIPALVAAALVGSLIVHMWKAGRHLKRNIEGRLQAASSNNRERGRDRRLPRRLRLHLAHDHARGHGNRAPDERAALPGPFGRHHRRRGRRHARGRLHRLALDPRRSPRQPRPVFSGHRGLPPVFVVQLVIYGVHESTDRLQAHNFPNSQPCNAPPSPTAPTASTARTPTYLLIVLPLGWLAVANVFKRGTPQRSQAA